LVPNLQSFPIAGIGASAGGVEALEGFFRGVPPQPGIGFVVITHLSPERESQLPQIIQRYTPLKVITAADGDKVKPDHVYVLPTDGILTIKGGCLQIRKQPPNRRERKPIDVFLSSLSSDQGERAISVVLSGGDGDGALGTKAVKERGGLTLAQAPDGHGPGHPEMPKSAIATGYVDFALPASEMGEKLVEFAGGGDVLDSLKLDPAASSREAAIDEARTEICSIIRHQLGHDFTGYKTRTFLRRVQRRMQVRQAANLDTYVEMLRQDAQEVSVLFRDLLINVTSFFRDAEAFDKLAELVIPKLFENRGAEHAVRVWVPGCATGEEVFSIAILLREYMDTLRAVPRVQIFATDIDEAALSVARAGRYPAALLDAVSAERKKRFFYSDGGSYVISKDVRDLCIFSPHSLIRDPPFSRIDLVSCRNLLIYLGPAVQNQVIPTFHYALRPGGYLFIGMSENVSQFDDLFDPIEKKHRIFRSREDAVRRLRLSLSNLAGSLPVSSGPRKPGGGLAGLGALQQHFESQVLERHAPPHVVVNAEGDVVYFSSRTARYLETPAGVPTRNLVSLAKKGIKLDLGAALRDAVEGNTPVIRKGFVPEEDGDGVVPVIVTVEPVWGQNRDDQLFLVLFEAEGVIAPAGSDGSGAEQHTDRAVQLEQQLRELKDRLQSTIEEYETSLEELKASNEELVSVNEELQSSNEELEASKEELQSMNEELHTVNNELAVKIEALDTANSDLRNLFDSTQIATIFLDRTLAIRSFTPAMTKIFHILPTDRGRPITDLASRLDMGGLRRDIESVLANGAELDREIHDGNTGAHYLIRTNAYRSAGGRIEGAVITFVDVTRLTVAEKAQEMLIRELHHRTRNLLTLVQSIAAHTFKTSGSMEDFQEKFSSRLSSLSRAQGLLSSSRPEMITLDKLLKMELEAYEITTESGRVNIAGPSVVLPDEMVRMMALAIHELVTNAVKYGAFHSADGRLSVKWDVAHGAGSETLTLEWCEDGVDVGLQDDGSAANSFGRYLIERGLPQQFGANTDYQLGNGRVHCTIQVPFSNLREREQQTGGEPETPTGFGREKP
jgi:two-component system, chemotaxis family, CheB/CheR fusion protein